ncbi:MAG TPA: hypothetical protein VI039_01695 [Solirubrobacterales bacterium]
MIFRPLTAALVAGALLLIPASASAAPAPAFKLTATAQPTNFAAGSEPDEDQKAFGRPQYSFVVTNVGSATTSGPIVFTDTLPDGLTPVSPGARDFNFIKLGSPLENKDISCDLAGQVVTCTDPEPLKPGQWAQFFVPVKVAEDAGPLLFNEGRVAGGGAQEARTAITTAVTDSLPPFDFSPGAAGLSAAATNADGTAASQAGSHPFQVTIETGLTSADLDFGGGLGGSLYSSGGHLKDLKVRLPRGMAVNPTATPVLCTEDQLASPAGCPLDSQVGVVTVLTDLGSGPVPTPGPVYNMVPPPGKAAELAFNALNVGIYVHLMGKVNSAGDYELVSDTSNVLARELNPILGVQVQLWGLPSDPSHDSMRGGCTVSSGAALSTCEETVARTGVPLLTMPGLCRPSLDLAAAASSWEEPQTQIGRDVLLEDPVGSATGTTGCDQLPFEPTIVAQPTTDRADSPTGLSFNLHVPQTSGFEELAAANFKDVSVTFPEGVAVNPAGANGLLACSPEQVGLVTGTGEQPVRFDEVPAACPDRSKIGSLEIKTPLLDHPLPGALYVAEPYENPFGSLLAIYLTVHDEATGVVAKLAGRVQADPRTGQITTVFEENPALPIEDVDLSVFGGPRAALKSPFSCGTYEVTSDITPWTFPEGAVAHPGDSFATSAAAADGGPCPTSEASAPQAQSFDAGTVSPRAGAYSPFLFKLSRADGTQQLSGIEATLPKGLVAKLAGVPYCSEAQIAQAIGREAPNLGDLEQQNPSCPAASAIGTVVVGAGAGPAPYYVTGHAYLAGPYKGAPLSLVIVTPAVAGPFDLGAVVNRTALNVDPETAQVRAVSDPLPQIIEGIPLDIRSIALKLDRPSFILNPTSCNPMAILGRAQSVVAQTAPFSAPFQVGGCGALGFKPKLSLRLKGETRRSGHPALTATLTYPKGSYANIAEAQVRLPHSAFLDQSRIKTICTRVQFAANSCPKGAIYGSAEARTPLLDQPLKGPVYLRSSSHALPDLVADLRGQLQVVLVGRIDSKQGGIRTTFEGVPDAPVSSFVLRMRGAKKGLLVNSTDICRRPHRAVAAFTGQNGLTYRARPVLTSSCKKKSRQNKRSKARH